jgi:hypothetical protein
LSDASFAYACASVAELAQHVLCHEYNFERGVRFMTSRESPPTDKASNTTSSRIFFLDIEGGRVVSVNPDGSDLKVIVEGCRGHLDGV